MTTTSDQDRAIEDIASFYPEGLSILPNAGPYHDRVVINLPDGEQIVIDPDGALIGFTAMSTRERDIVQILAERGRKARAEGDAPEGYDPACDLLLIERPDGETCVVPPWRCALAVQDHLPRGISMPNWLTPVEEWAEIVLHRPLRTWRLANGETVLQQTGD